jgi:hypothetical protein
VGDVDLGDRLEQLGTEMGRAADPDRGVIELARLLPRERDELLQSLCRQRRLDDQHLVAHRHHRDRCEIALPVIGHALVEARGDGQRTVGRKIKCIAVGL